MLVPLGVLAAGSILAGYPFYQYFAGHEVGEFFRESLQDGADHPRRHPPRAAARRSSFPP